MSTCQRVARSNRWRRGALVALVGCAAGVSVPAATASAQAPIDGTVDVDVLGTNIHLELRIGPSERPAQPPRPGEPPPAPLTPPSRATFDDQMAEITRRVPDFGGLFVNERKKTLYVYMQGGLRRAAASAAGRPRIERALRLIARRFRIAMPRVRVLRARYDFGQLDRWKDRMGHLFRIRGVTSLDVEDSKNRLEVGVQNARIRRAVRRRLGRLRVPRRAVRLRREAPVVPDSSLQDLHRPLVAGLQIAKDPRADGTADVCTLGFVAWSQRHRRWGFVTNSHCTDRRGGVESTRFYQHWKNGKFALGRPGTDLWDAGTEVDDPGYHSCYGFFGFSCRYSDAAFAAFPDWFASNFGTSYELGGIPDPVFGCCTLAYDPNRRGAFIGEWHPPKGHGVCKTGRSTGPTCGAIQDTCNDSFMQGGFVYRCQFTASYGRDGGDSGAPVWAGVAPGQAYLVGIHSGANPDGGSFSPIGNIQRADELDFLWNCRDYRC